MSAPPRARTIWISGGLVFVLLETAMIWVRIGAAPLFWICLLWTAGALLLFRQASSTRARMVWINLAAVIAAVGLCEGALWIGQQRNPYSVPAGVVMGGTFARPGHFVLMPAAGLGYRPRPGASATSIRTVYGRLAYSVRYDVDGDGLRITPPGGPGAPRACVLMFGDSMAWGEGVEDYQTTAYQLGVLSRGRVYARNFAFTGYGAHQMLWQVLNGEVAAKAHCDRHLPVLAVYQTLPNNIARVAGLRGWDEYGPRYRLRGDRLVYAGGFDRGQSILDDRLYVPGPIAAALSRSVVYSRVLGLDRPPNSFDLTRYCAIVRRAADGLHQLYPRLQFLVIVWPDLNDPERSRAAKVAALVEALRARQLRTVTVNDVQPGFDAAPLPFLIALDGHPNAVMHARLTRILLARVPMLRQALRDLADEGRTVPAAG
ncbi:hypothetical protein Q4F19_15680 [Sphingomonas sp. BIUV-7]|uniref:SGNH/GDSL hydrolase family protein n=1 Tax=Sphingomonas natans TaxID=3063330 RepID=A0ABT8YBW8_9SPHN|nr:hypothetical protein [Sphingomonas sp. BIUV-7]MDO6415832.1 hypothetical protein [Sphingomonas sp. BIUV-7]